MTNNKDIKDPPKVKQLPNITLEKKCQKKKKK